MKEKLMVINKDVNKEEALKLSKDNIDFIIAEMLVKRGIRTFDQSKQFFRPDLNIYNHFW